MREIYRNAGKDAAVRTDDLLRRMPTEEKISQSSKPENGLRRRLRGEVPTSAARRDFQRVRIRAGESRKITFIIGKQELGFFNRELQYVVEPGRFTVAVGDGLTALREVELEIINKE